MFLILLNVIYCLLCGKIFVYLITCTSDISAVYDSIFSFFMLIINVFLPIFFFTHIYALLFHRLHDTCFVYIYKAWLVWNLIFIIFLRHPYYLFMHTRTRAQTHTHLPRTEVMLAAFISSFFHLTLALSVCFDTSLLMSLTNSVCIQIEWSLPQWVCGYPVFPRPACYLYPSITPALSEWNQSKPWTCGKKPF